jgi:hypothetical protein
MGTGYGDGSAGSSMLAFESNIDANNGHGWLGAHIRTTALPQFAPAANQCNENLLQSHSGAGIVVGMGDGSVRLVASGVSASTWAHAIMPDDGVPLGSDW